MQNQKLLLIGWDAADWQVIEPLMAEGKMPALQRMLSRGSSGNIATLNPPLSPMLWTSIATGKRAYDHGILGFVQADKVKGEVQAVRATSRKVKAFWNILNEAGLKTNVINWWPSHPAEELNGACITNFYHKEVPPFGKDWPLSRDAIYPADLFETLKDLRLHPAELTLNHVLPFIPEADKLDPESDAVLKPLLRILAHCSSVHNAATWLMENRDWDVTAVYYEAIDHFSHLAMKYHPPKQAGIDQEEYDRYKNIIEAAYRFHDMLLDRLLSLAGEDCNVMLLSDHGFESGGLRVETLPDIPAAPALEHRRYGVFAAAGPAFRKDKVYGISLLDVTPTILHLFQLPVGVDMEGQVMKSIFRDDCPVSEIDSWESTAEKVRFVNTNDNLSDEGINQLKELGYIDLPKEGKLKYVEYELNYNLCQSLADGGKWERACTVARKLYEEFADERAAIMLSTVLLRANKFTELQPLLDELFDKNPNHPQLLFIQAMSDLYTGQVQKAGNDLIRLEDLGIQSTQLFNEIGRAFLILGNLKTARKYFTKSLVLDTENVTAMSGMGQCLLENGEYAEAMEYLEKSLQLVYFQPNVHYLMAQALIKLGYADQSIVALEVCLHQAPKHEKARALKSRLQNEGAFSIKKPVIVVSGLPRSGTSLLMQMLKAGGVGILSDIDRGPDIHNPHGYLEYSPVKSLGVTADWMQEARGKAIKVVSPLLRYLPATESYRIIYIRRPLTEVIVSQQLMKGGKKEEVMREFPFQLAVDLQAEEERVKHGLAMQPNVEYLELEFHETIQYPLQVAGKIAEFLKVNFDKKEASDAVDPNLHRNKLGE